MHRDDKLCEVIINSVKTVFEINSTIDLSSFSNITDCVYTLFKLAKPSQIEQLSSVWFLLKNSLEVEFKVAKLFYESETVIFYEVYKKTPENITLVLAKYDKEKVHSIHAEAFIQHIVGTILSYYGLENVVPKIHHSLLNQKGTEILIMEPIYNAVLASTFLTRNLQFNKKMSDNDCIILDILGQLVIYLEILNKTIHFQHRDLKSNNILLIKPLKEKSTKTIQIGSNTYIFTFYNQVVLLDYGFASLADYEKNILITTSTKINTIDKIKIKNGTDMFTYLSTLYRSKELRGCITDKLLQLFQKWLKTKTKDWAKYLEKDMEPEDIPLTYMFTEMEEFSADSADSGKIFTDLCEAYPERFQSLSASSG